MNKRNSKKLLIVMFSLWTTVVVRGSETQLPIDMTGFTLGELMDIEVTTVAKKTQKLAGVAAAVTVITSEEIRRSGANTIPDILRTIPGIDVSQISAHNWAISSRGFSDQFANKLLVLIDGRSVYTPLFSGVFWEFHDIVLEDIERIEVIRGPGGTIWGANAVNGIINIITKPASDTTGALVSASAGSEDRGTVTVRYGGNHHDQLHYRFFLKALQHDDGFDKNGKAEDDWRTGRSGFRMDWESRDTDLFTLSGDYFRGHYDANIDRPSVVFAPSETLRDTTTAEGGNLLLKWQHQWSESSAITLQSYYDRVEVRNDILFDYTRDTFDLDFHNNIQLTDSQEIIWGLGYRFIYDRTGNKPNLSFANDRRSYDLFSAFLQDEISLIKDELFLTIGSKIEYNEFTGDEIQPSTRLAWTIDPERMVWLAYSRAVRTPSRAENDMILALMGTAFGIFTLEGNEKFESETVDSLEAGFRVSFNHHLTVDTAVFYNLYDQLRTFEPSGDPLTVVVDNKMDAETYGAEIEANLALRKDVRIYASYSFLKMNFHLDNDSLDFSSEDAEGNNPRNRATLGISVNLGNQIEIDTTLRYVDNLSAVTSSIDQYLALDVRLGWHPTDNLELAVVARNLLDDHHPEFTAPISAQATATEIQHSIRLNLTWRF